MSPIRRLRYIGIAEGLSFILLLGIAMPLKYIWGMPMAVRIVGSLHGALFVAYCVALFIVWRKLAWPITKAAMCFIAAWLPFGTFAIDPRLKREELAQT